MQEKERAPKNRTLTLSDDDKIILKKKLDEILELKNK